MEGVFAFFLESSFLGVLLFRKRFGRRVQWFATLMLFVGTWLSGYFILATNAWMQHPVTYQAGQDGRLFVNSLAGLLTNPCMTDPALSLTVFNAATDSYGLTTGFAWFGVGFMLMLAYQAYVYSLFWGKTRPDAQ